MYALKIACWALIFIFRLGFECNLDITYTREFFKDNIRTQKYSRQLQFWLTTTQSENSPRAFSCLVTSLNHVKCFHILRRVQSDNRKLHCDNIKLHCYNRKLHCVNRKLHCDNRKLHSVITEKCTVITENCTLWLQKIALW